MARNKPPQAPGPDDPVEVSNLSEDTEQSQVAALKALADSRAKRIEELEKDRDRMLAETSGRRVQAPQNGARVHVKSVELVTSPEHSLVLHVLGDDEALRALKVALESVARCAGVDNTDTDGVDASDLTDQIAEAFRNSPRKDEPAEAVDGNA
jgi:hypothetical protein